MTCRPTPTVAAFGRVISGGTSTRRSRWAVGEAGQPPALPELVGREGPRVEPGDRDLALDDPDLALAAGAVAAARRVDRDAVPATRRRTRVTPGGTRTSRSAARFFCSTLAREEGDPHPAHAVRCRLGRRRGRGGRSPSRPSRRYASRGAEVGPSGVAVTACPSRNRVRRRRPDGSPSGQRSAVAPPAAAFCLARSAAIQFAPHSSLPSIRSAALTASTICGVAGVHDRAGQPGGASAIGRNVAPRVCRPGMPKETLEAPQGHVQRRTRRGSARSSPSSSVPYSWLAPTGIASGSITMSSIGMSYFVGGDVDDLLGELEALVRVLGDLVLVVRQRDHRGAVLLHERAGSPPSARPRRSPS